MPENADENGDFRKRFQKLRLLKTHPIENASFLVWTGKKRHLHFPLLPVQIRVSVQDGGWSCHAQFQVPVLFIVFERFSVDR